ncbi:hypothetical protein STEG23_032817, partial [Scotinomys teguina]
VSALFEFLSLLTSVMNSGTEVQAKQHSKCSYRSTSFLHYIMWYGEGDPKLIRKLSLRARHLHDGIQEIDMQVTDNHIVSEGWCKGPKLVSSVCPTEMMLNFREVMPTAPRNMVYFALFFKGIFISSLRASITFCKSFLVMNSASSALVSSQRKKAICNGLNDSSEISAVLLLKCLRSTATVRKAPKYQVFCATVMFNGKILFMSSMLAVFSSTCGCFHKSAVSEKNMLEGTEGKGEWCLCGKNCGHSASSSTNSNRCQREPV